MFRAALLFTGCAIGIGLAPWGLSGCGGTEADPGAALAEPGRHVALACQGHPLFLNFGGVTLQGMANCEDARRNCSAIVGHNLGNNTSVTIPPFSGSATAQQQIVALVTQYYQPFNVQIVTERPSSGTYSMVAIGGLPSVVHQTDAAGIGILDCGNKEDNNISFSFSDRERNVPASVAMTIAQEAAHAYGLGHVDDPTDVMYVGPSHMVGGFHDKAMNIPDGSGCSGSVQNDSQLLTANVGASCGAGPAQAGAGGSGGQEAGDAGGPGGAANGIVPVGSGCAIAPRQSLSGWAPLAAAVALGWAARRRRRARTIAYR